MTVMDTHRKNSVKVGYDILRIDDDQGSRRKIVLERYRGIKEESSFFESIPENI
jgi:hypothetical protein